MRLILVALLATTVECGKAGGRYRRIQRIAAQQRPHHNLSNTDYRSVGKLAPLTKVFDMAERGVPRKVAAQRSYRGEIMLFTSDASMAGWSFHFVSQLRARGYEHWLILADKKASCRGIHEQWEAVEQKHGDKALSCVYSSYPRTHPGWKQWRPGGGQRGVEDSMHNVYILWATRWWVALKLLRQGLNVLSLDVDAVLLSDIYQLLRSPPLSAQDVIITRNDDGSQSLNCGFVYFNRDARRAAAYLPGQQQQQRVEPGACPAAPAQAVAGAGALGEEGAAAVAAVAVPAAEWVCELMWERLRLFLEVDARSLSKMPAREVLWEQDAWNDLAKSLELNRRVFPWVTGYGKRSDMWSKLGYERRVVDTRTHPEKWVAWRKLKLDGVPPLQPSPTEGKWAHNFFNAQLRSPLLWLPLCSPANQSSRASVVPPAGSVEGIPLGLESELPLLPGRMLVAPPWLASLGNDPEPDWAGASPSPLAYVHITNMWKCFPHPCWSKAGRLFWLRAHGFWDGRLDELGLTPRGAPFDAGTRVLALPPATHAAVEALGREVAAAGGSAKSRLLGFRRLHALIHNLVTAAALLGRRPVIPQVPCDFVRAVQSPELWSAPKSRFGLCHAAIVATGPPDAPTCHLTPGTWRPGGPDQCYHNAVMSHFDYVRFAAARPAAATNGSVRVSSAAQFAPSHAAAAEGDAFAVRYKKGSMDLAPLAQLCEQAAAQPQAAVLTLDGLLPLADALIDRPLPLHEFVSEAQRQKSRQPRWPSLLQQAELRQLASSCPGAKQLVAFRKQCVGYFLAE